MSSTRPILSKQELLITLVCCIPISIGVAMGYLFSQNNEKFVGTIDGDTENTGLIQSSTEKCELTQLLAVYAKQTTSTTTIQPTNLKLEDKSTSSDNGANEAATAFDHAYDQYFATTLGQTQSLAHLSHEEKIALQEQIRTSLKNEPHDLPSAAPALEAVQLSEREIKVGILAQIYEDEGYDVNSSQFDQRCETLILREAMANKQVGKLHNKRKRLYKAG